MSKTIVNLTMPVVVQEIEETLETYPYYPYQEAFAHPDYRRTLVAYILSRVPNCYVTVDEEEVQFVNRSSDSLRRSLAEMLQIEAIIRQGIEKIITEEAQQVSRHIPEVADPTTLPSNWFG